MTELLNFTELTEFFWEGKVRAEDSEFSEGEGMGSHSPQKITKKTKGGLSDGITGLKHFQK